MHLSTVSEWLDWINRIHSTEIDLGLDRVHAAAANLNLLSPTFPVITVGGTNGKGSTVASLEAIYLAADYRVGTFTSPFLFSPNEQVRINGQGVNDQTLCAAFAKVEETRGDISLTPFEFFTLAALFIFQTHGLDVLILEVGLGGRLDAVNIIDASVSVVTSIGIDHVNYLGHTREEIGREKAGIFRSQHPAVCGDVNPPVSLTTAATDLGAPLYLQGREFHFEEKAATWDWRYQTTVYQALPLNSLATQNMSTVLMVITLLQEKLPVSRSAIETGLADVKVPGRIQVIDGPVTEIFDVSHNPHAVAFLKNKLITMPCRGNTYAVFSMLADKDISGSIGTIKDMIDDWYVAPLSVKRAAVEDELEKAFARAEIDNVAFHPTIVEAYLAADTAAKPGDRIIIFGSFHTVADVWMYKSRAE